MFQIDFENLAGIIIISWMSIIVSLMTYIIYENKDDMETNMFSMGPNPELYILGFCIDTFPKYRIVASFCFINSGIRELDHNLLRPWIINQIQDTKNKNQVDSRKAYSISLLSVVYVWFDWFMYMNILLAQIDMLFIEIAADLIMTVFLTKYYLGVKVALSTGNP